jgi:hypothetical protein
MHLSFHRPTLRRRVTAAAWHQLARDRIGGYIRIRLQTAARATTPAPSNSVVVCSIEVGAHCFPDRLA